MAKSKKKSLSVDDYFECAGCSKVGHFKDSWSPGDEALCDACDTEVSGRVHKHHAPALPPAELKRAKALLKSASRMRNPVDGQIVLAPVQPPPPPSGTTSIFKLAAGVAVVGLVGAGIYKFFTKPMGTLVIDHKEPKPVVEPVEPAPEKPLVGSKILAKLPAFNAAATGTVPYYVINVFAAQDLTRPEPGAVDIATYLRSVPAEDIQVYGPYMPGQKPDRFEGPLPTLAVIVAPNGMVITSMNQAELAAITPAQ